MTNENIFVTGLLLAAGIIGLAVGAMSLFMPDAFYQSAGVTIGNSASLRSEIRAPGGFLLALSVFVIWSAITRNQQFQALVITSTIYLGYGIARVYSFAFDGAPSSSIIIAMIVELLVGAAALYAVIRSPKLTAQKI